MTAHEIRPKQLRALLLLLVLVPLIPAVLMIRFMLDTIHVEELAAFDRLQQLHSETLRTALKNAPKSAEMPPEARSVALVRSAEALAGSSVAARVIGASGDLLAGNAEPWGQVLAQSSVESIPGATIQLHLVGQRALDEVIAGQRQILFWTGVITIFSVLLIAGLAAATLNRQIAIRDLKSTSVATVAHELRTPLASMRMLVDTLLEGRYRGDTQLREYLQLVAAENERLSRLAEAFLTFSRLDRSNGSLSLQPTPVSTIVERALVPLHAQLQPPACEFTQTTASDVSAVLANADSLSQVLTNLIDNALKYSDAPAHVRLSVESAGQFIKFVVADQGIGIPDNERKTIFEPFYQVDQKLSRRREGCGLGLAITREIVKAHHGTISVASEPGKGSVFEILIPSA